MSFVAARLCRLFCALPVLAASESVDPWISTGRQPDPTAKTLSDLRAAEKRRIPIDVQLKSSDSYPAGGSVDVTVIITNLFDKPLVMNSRMLVNHPLLQGELSFRIVDSHGKKVEIQRLITPLSVRDRDFVTLSRGESMQRSVDLADLFGMTRKGHL